MEESFSKFQSLLEEKSHFVLTSHIDPDGDGLGGILALKFALEQLGKTVAMSVSTPISKRYDFLNGIQEVSTELPDFPGNRETVLLTVDAPNIPRLGFEQEKVDQLNPTIVNLDHHTSNERFGDLVILDEASAASCEVIFDLLDYLGIHWTPEMATACYTGILTDTGRFRFTNTRPNTFKASAVLLEAGAEHELCVRQLFEEKPFGRLVLESKVLPTVRKEGTLAFMYCDLTMIEEAAYEETEDLVNRMTEIEGVQVAAFFKEVEPEFTKISLRAVKNVDVNAIASKFGGGGHAKAAGCKIKKPLKEARELVLEQCKLSLKEYGYEA